jgi:hypothetical protein
MADLSFKRIGEFEDDGAKGKRNRAFRGWRRFLQQLGVAGVAGESGCVRWRLDWGSRLRRLERIEGVGINATSLEEPL